MKGLTLPAMVLALLAGAAGCSVLPACKNGPGDVPGECLRWPSSPPPISQRQVG